MYVHVLYESYTTHCCIHLARAAHYNNTICYYYVLRILYVYICLYVYTCVYTYITALSIWAMCRLQMCTHTSYYTHIYASYQLAYDTCTSWHTLAAQLALYLYIYYYTYLAIISHYGDTSIIIMLCMHDAAAQYRLQQPTLSHTIISFIYIDHSTYVRMCMC